MIKQHLSIVPLCTKRKINEKKGSKKKLFRTGQLFAKKWMKCLYAHIKYIVHGDNFKF